MLEALYASPNPSNLQDKSLYFKHKDTEPGKIKWRPMDGGKRVTLVLQIELHGLKQS